MALWSREINLNSLVQFAAIARHRSLKLAAEELHLTSPALTHALRRLEDSLGTRLCERRRGVFRLTDAGQKLFVRCEAILSSLDEYRAELHEPERFAGVVNVGVLDNYQDTRITGLLRSVLERYPATRLALQALSSEEITARLVLGDLDLGIGFFGSQDSSLEYRETRRETFRMYLGAAHPLFARRRITRRDLKGQAAVWVDHRSRNRLDLERRVFSSALHGLQVMGFTNNLSSALLLLRTGRYLAPLPPSFARPLVATGELRELRAISDSLAVVTEHVVFDPRRELPAPVRAFVDSCR